jgi:hypothetical protein
MVGLATLSNGKDARAFLGRIFRKKLLIIYSLGSMPTYRIRECPRLQQCLLHLLHSLTSNLPDIPMRSRKRRLRDLLAFLSVKCVVACVCSALHLKITGVVLVRQCTEASVEALYKRRTRGVTRRRSGWEAGCCGATLCMLMFSAFSSRSDYLRHLLTRIPACYSYSNIPPRTRW